MKTVKIADKDVELKCCRKDCGSIESKMFSPEVKIWAQGFAKSAHKPAHLALSAIFCENHVPSEKEFLENFFPPENRLKLRDAFIAARKVPLNWASVEIKWREVK